MRTVTGLRVIATAQNVLAMHHDGRQIEPGLLEWAKHISLSNSEGGNVIDHQTYENAIRKPWRLCEVPRAPECDKTGQCKQGRCSAEPDREAIETEPADLEDTQHSVESTGIVLAVAMTFAGILLGYGLASWWPAG